MAFFLFGCSSVHLYSRMNTGQGAVSIKKVGILPFMNESGRQKAGEIVTNTFIAESFKAGLFSVEENGNIEQFLLREKIRVDQKLHTEQLIRLGKRLSVDAVFVGTVEKFSGGNMGKMLPTPEVCIRAKLIYVKDSMVLWMARHCRTGDEYATLFEIGQVRTVGTLTKHVISEMLDTVH